MVAALLAACDAGGPVDAGHDPSVVFDSGSPHDAGAPRAPRDAGPHGPYWTTADCPTGEYCRRAVVDCPQPGYDAVQDGGFCWQQPCLGAACEGFPCSGPNDCGERHFCVVPPNYWLPAPPAVEGVCTSIRVCGMNPNGAADCEEYLAAEPFVCPVCLCPACR